MIEKYTDVQYTQLPYEMPISNKESYEQGYSDGRASMVNELESLRTEIQNIAISKTIVEDSVDIAYWKSRHRIITEDEALKIIDEKISKAKRRINEKNS